MCRTHRLSTTRLSWARVAAARGVAQFDRTQALAFLKRELNHRDLWICAAAVGALNELTGQSLAFDFRIPSERNSAIDASATAVIGVNAVHGDHDAFSDFSL